MMDYLELLNYSYKKTIDIYEDKKLTRAGYLADHIFDFTLYDNDMSELFGRKCVEVCQSISDKNTFKYQKDNYQWYLVMVNMKFLEEKISWGTSIRGAWWDIYDQDTFTIDARELWKDQEQIGSLSLNESQWNEFVQSMVAFIK